MVKDQLDSKKTAYTIVKAGFYKGPLSILSRQISWVQLAKGCKRYFDIISVSCDIWCQRITGYAGDNPASPC